MLNRQAVESKEIPGFYEIPGYKNYVVSRDGKVYSFHQNAILQGSRHSSGYMLVRLTRDDGRVLTWGIHRLLGYVFLNPGSNIDGLVINHKNAVKDCNDLKNLEWVTYQGNAEHAGKNNLTEKCAPIAVRDVRTGEVTEYPSFISYARSVGWSKDKVAWRVRIGETRVFPEGKQYRLASVKTPWYQPKNVDVEMLFNSRSRKTLIKFLLSGTETEFKSLSSAAESLGVSKATLCGWMKLKNQPVLPGFIQVKFSHDETPWRGVVDPYLEYEVYSGNRVVVVKEEESGEVHIFHSARDCGEKMYLSPQCLNYRLKSKGEDVFIDGYSYAYYADSLV